MSKNYGTRRCSNCRCNYHPTVNTQLYCKPACNLASKKKKAEIKNRQKAETKVKVLERRDRYSNKQHVIGNNEMADYIGVTFHEFTANLLTTTLKEIPYVSTNLKLGKSGSEKIYNKKDVANFFTTIGYIRPIDRLLTMQNYKEPLTPVPDGYGYLGTVMATKDGEYIQCHICGKLLQHMSGHIFQTHKMKVAEYKEQFGLSPRTALASEKVRWELKRRGLEFFKNLTPEKKEEFKIKRRESLLKGRTSSHRTNRQPKESLEQKNLKGTCPQQLLAKIQEVASDLGYTPSLKEFVTECGSQRYKHLIIKTHGSWLKAVALAGLDKRVPKGVPKKYKKHDTEELLEYLKIFAEENNEIPTHTDFISGVLPEEGIYVRRFGSIENARQQAGVYDVVDQDKLDEFDGKSKRKRSWYGMPQFQFLKPKKEKR